MNTKLKLTIERKIIERAKAYAKDKNLRLSDIIENYLKMLRDKKPDKQNNLSPSVASLKGSFKPPNYFDDKKELRNRLEKKYL